MGLAAFPTMEEGDTLNPATTSPAPSPKPTAPVTGGPPPAPECDELSLVRTHFLLFKVDLDEPQISRLHGYDRKPRSEFFHSRLKTLFNRQYQSIYLYCIRIHVLHHCCHLHHHPHGNELCVYKSIYGRGGGGCQRAGGCFGTPTPAFNAMCRCGAARGSPCLVPAPCPWAVVAVPPGSELPAVTRGVCLSVTPWFDPPCAFHQSPSGAVWPPVPPDLVAGASPMIPCNIDAPALLPFLARMNWERFLGGSLGQDTQPAQSCCSQSPPRAPSPAPGCPQNPSKGEE